MVNYFTIMVHKEILQCYVLSQIFPTQLQIMTLKDIRIHIKLFLVNY